MRRRISPRSSCMALIFLSCIESSANGLALRNERLKTAAEATMDRRSMLLTGAVTAASSLIRPSRTWGVSSSSEEEEEEEEEEEAGGPLERQKLLTLIRSSKSSESDVLKAIEELEPLDPSRGNAAVSPLLGGTWELIYSVNADAFSPLLNLPKAIRPKSLQLLGEDAALKVGRGRVAQVLDFPFAPLSLVLSSGTVPVATDPSMLEIFPPFRLELTVAKTNTFPIVEAGSDADFRSINARDSEAQAAPRNMYKQRYLDTTGNKGDIRISEVVSGDPVIVGSLFIHRRL